MITLRTPMTVAATIHPINGHTGNIEEVNMEEQIQGEFQEKNKEEQ